MLKKDAAFFSTSGHMLKVAARRSKKTPCLNTENDYILLVQ